MDISPKIQSILQDSLDRKLSVFLSCPELNLAFETRLLHLQSEHLVIKNTVPPELITQMMRSTNFYLQCQMVVFETDQIISDGANIQFSNKQFKLLEETRQVERTMIQPNTHAVAQMLNPFDGETMLSKPLMDLSTSGMSIRTQALSKLYQPGVLFKNIHIMVNGKSVKQANGRVVYRRIVFNPKGRQFSQVGFRFENS